MTEENGFKQTEIDSIPEDWGYDRLGNLCRVFSGYAFKSEDFVSSGIVVVKIGNLQNGTLVIDNRTTYFTENKVSDRHQRFVLHKDDVLIALTGATTGKIAVVPPSFDGALLNQRVGKFEINSDKLNQLFFRFYALTGSFQKEIKDNILQSAQGNVSPQKIESFEILIPRIWEQKKIAYVLYELHRTIAQQEQIIAKTKELKCSLMHRLFTYGLRGEELKETEIGLMPESWSAKRLKDVVEKTSQRDMTKNPDIQFKYIDVSSISNDSFKITESTTYKGSEAPSRARKIIRTNDILFATVRPTLKRIAYVENEFDGEVCSTAFCVLRSVSILSSRYLYYCVQRDSFIESLGKLQRGASYPAVTDGNVKDQLIPFPTLDEQEEIANILWDIDNKINHETAKKNMLKDLFKSMLQLLMTGQVRVKDIDFGKEYE